MSYYIYYLFVIWLTNFQNYLLQNQNGCATLVLVIIGIFLFFSYHCCYMRFISGSLNHDLNNCSFVHVKINILYILNIPDIRRQYLHTTCNHAWWPWLRMEYLGINFGPIFLGILMLSWKSWSWRIRLPYSLFVFQCRTVCKLASTEERGDAGNQCKPFLNFTTSIDLV